MASRNHSILIVPAISVETKTNNRRPTLRDRLYSANTIMMIDVQPSCDEEITHDLPREATISSSGVAMVWARIKIWMRHTSQGTGGLLPFDSWFIHQLCILRRNQW